MDVTKAFSESALDAAQVEEIIRNGLPMAARSDFSVERLAPGVAELGFGHKEWMIRPGGSVAGPVMMMAADTAMYAVLLAHTKGEEMTLTSDLTFHFLGRAKPGGLHVTADLLKLGRRAAVCDVRIRDTVGTLVCHACGTYMRPPG